VDRARILILGIGNILMRDDGAGVRAVEALRESVIPESVEVVDGGTAGLALIDEIEGRERVIVIDAMDAGDPPGTVRRMTPDDLAGGAAGALSLHEFGLLQALDGARLLGRAPREVIVYGVQVKDVSLGLDLSDEVAAALPALAGRALADALR